MEESQAPLVSVIVPNYNHERFLKRRLQSIREQTFQNFELIILDDASTDNSIRVIREQLSGYPYRLIMNPKNSGSPCSQWLKGIGMAKGEFVWIAESDDDAAPEFLETMVGCITAEACLIYCRTIEIDQRGIQVSDCFWPDFIEPRRWHSSFSSHAGEELRIFLTRLNIIPNASCCLFRRHCVKEPGYFNSWRYAGDWLFWSFLLAQSPGSVIMFHASPLAFHRSHEQTTRHLSSSSENERKRFREYSVAIGNILDLARVGWIERWRMSRSDAWDWTYLAFQMQKSVFKSAGQFSPPFIGWHYLGYLFYLIRQLEQPFNTKMALTKHQLRKYVHLMTGK